jgi:hypothetical protein
MITYKSMGIQKFILDRLTQIYEDVIENDPEYKELGERPGELLKLIAAKLMPEDKKLLDEYQDIWIYQFNRQDELIYSQGLMDGILFGYWAAVVGQGMGKIVV